MSRNFGVASATGQVIAAGVASAATLIDAGGAFPDILLYNPGPNIVRVRAGGASVVADANCIPILAGEKSAYFKGSATHLATLSPSGPQNIEVFEGEGQ